MTIPKLSTRSLDTVQHRQRVAESINNILSFEADDSRRRAAAESSAGVTPTNFAYPPGDVRRYGWSAAASGATNYAALVAANAVSTISGECIEIPAGVYAYDPPAYIELASNMRGAGLFRTLLKVDSGYAGEVFRIGSWFALSDLWIQLDTLPKTAGSIGLRLSARSIGLATVDGNMRCVYDWQGQRPLITRAKRSVLQVAFRLQNQDIE